MDNNKNLIGLDTVRARELADKLNELLANFQLFYANVRGFHWNVAGEQFFELHLKFEELYNYAFQKIDEIAERIRTLGYAPQHTYSAYLQQSQIKEATSVSNGREDAEQILNSLQTLLGLERNLQRLANAAADEGTSNLIGDYIQEQEKMVWMYAAYLK